MKNLKLKSILFSLMAITMVTVFLSSCTKTDLPQPLEDNLQISETSKHSIYLPAYINAENESEVLEFMKNTSSKELMQYEKDAIIYEHLKSLNKAEEVRNLYGKSFESYSKVDLSKHISDQEFKSLDDKLGKVNEIESRHCIYLGSICYYYDKICCVDRYCYYCTQKACYNVWEC